MKSQVRAATAAAIIGSLTFAAAADAVPARGTGKAKSATYTVDVYIEQDTEWQYRKRVQPSCDWPETGDGFQKLTVATLKGRPRVRVTGKKIRVLKPKPVPNFATAHIETEWERKFSQISPCPGGGNYGGGDGPNKDAKGKDICVTSGEVYLRVGNSRGQVYPTPGDSHRPKGEVGKGALVVRADPAWSAKSVDSYQTLPGKCSAEGKRASLGLTDTRGEYNGGIIEVVRKVPLKKLLDPKRRKFRIDARRILSYPNEIQKSQPQEVTTGKTVADVRLVFRRVKK